MLKKKIKVYMSHPIRGVLREKATEETMKANNQKAIAWGRELWGEFGSQIDLYVPGEHDEFVLIAYLNGFLTEKQLLDVDCVIVSRCKAVIVANWENFISHGMLKEINHADNGGIPVFFLDNLDAVNLEKLRVFLETL
ncbi:hypothetical protein LCGC14_1712640 [marine sediment metagenome]|uniref:Nucleoside 2-deoxyribosyltransferase n=1 Tax=marine sediment metagenome TaxID=412755 RepID=A0A0F9HF56_9ZZZZ